MSKRITLSYSIEWDELEDEVSRLYSRAHDLMQATTESMYGHPATQCLSLSTFQSIDETRTQLAKIDIMLAEIGQIFGSYLEYKNDDTPSTTMSALKTKLEDIQNEIATVTSESPLPQPPTDM